MENENRVEYVGFHLKSSMPDRSFHTFELFMYPFPQAQGSFMIDMDTDLHDSTDQAIGMAHMRMSNLLKDYAEQLITAAVPYLARGAE